MTVVKFLQADHSAFLKTTTWNDSPVFSRTTSVNLPFEIDMVLYSCHISP
jgi:hypothetical protein